MASSFVLVISAYVNQHPRTVGILTRASVGNNAPASRNSVFGFGCA